MRYLKTIFIILISIVLTFELGIVLSGKYYLNKLLYNTIFKGKLNPDIDELHDFETRKINNSTGIAWPYSTKYNKAKINADIYSKFSEYECTAFLVVKNDSLLFEKYWENYDSSTLSNSFSMSKSFVTALIGIALKEGKIKSVEQDVSNFIQEFNTPEKSKIKIKHLLTMSSGLDFNENYLSPFSWPAEAYYGKDVNSISINVKSKHQPGAIWKYKGGDTQLLGIILQKATGVAVSEYAQENLWSKIGAEFPAFWSLDKKDGMEKVSCCFYSVVRDFARMGRLFMNYGYYNGEQLIDSSFIKESLQSVNIPDEEGKIVSNYGFQWWLLDYKGKEIFYCRGIRGQYIFEIPSEKLIIVRLGHKRSTNRINGFPEDIFLYLDAALGIK